jgi:hypothetical protein
VNGDAGTQARILDETWALPAWHGPNLRAAVRGVSAAQAVWRPGPGRHSIWEIVRHLTYWTFIARRRLGLAPGQFPHRGTNWFTCPDTPDERAWRADVALLSQQHRLLRDAVAAPGRRSHGATIRTPEDRFRLLLGIACHGMYHAGQIQLLKRLQASR